jgi:hypothetical protein
MPKLSQQEEVKAIFKEILVSANVRLPICGLEQFSFFYDVQDDGIGRSLTGTCTSIKQACLPTLLSVSTGP